jgi:hypothetical protein
MAVCDIRERMTSESIYIEYLPFSCDPASHVQHFYFDSAVSSGTFKLAVNGNVTAAITFSATEATLITAVNAALDALPNLAAGDLVLSGADITDMILTATATTALLKFFLVEVYDDSLVQAVPNSNPHVTTEVTTQGSGWVRLSDDISAVDWELSVETVDVTAISEYNRTEVPVADSVSGTASFYKNKANAALEQFALFLTPEKAWGILRIYPEGKVLGKEVITLRALVENFSESYPDHEKVEQELSFQRQGAWITRPTTVYSVNL